MSELNEKQVDCPGCKAKVLWTTDNPHRPFCSDQCRNKDFIGWASENKIISGNSIYDDILSEDLPHSD